MNKNVKFLIIGVAITAIIAYSYFKRKNDALEQSYNQQLESLQLQGSETAKKNEEFVAINQDCELIGTFKKSLNLFVGFNLFDNLTIYDLPFKTDLDKLLEGTTHFYDETKGLRKSFLYDISISTANAMGLDIPPRQFNYEYTSGVLTIGDKGNDVNTLQTLVNSIYSKIDFTERLDVNGTYDKATNTAVVGLFAGTTALIDSTKGTISKEFVNNFTIIINNLKIN